MLNPPLKPPKQRENHFWMQNPREMLQLLTWVVPGTRLGVGNLAGV